MFFDKVRSVENLHMKVYSIFINHRDNTYTIGLLPEKIGSFLVSGSQNVKQGG